MLNKPSIFLNYANKFNVKIEDCFVLDNSKWVCDTFSNLGGNTCLVTKEAPVNIHLDLLFDRFVKTALIL